MTKPVLAPLVAAIALVCGSAAGAQTAAETAAPTAPASGSNTMPGPKAMPGSGVNPDTIHHSSPSMQSEGMHSGGMMPLGSGPDHGMPAGTAGGDGAIYSGKPSLQAAISLVTAGGAPGHFSIVKALTVLAGPTVAQAESAKLLKQYGATAFNSYVTVQNYAVNDAVKRALAAGVKFPAPNLTGATLAKRVVALGLLDGTFYTGYQLDHLVTNPIHEAVMGDIDAKYGKKADANYHRVSDQAHYDLAQALGVTSVKLAPFH